MVSEETTKYLSDFLYDKISKSVQKDYGLGDVSPKKDKEAELCDLFETYIYAANLGYFLMSGSGVMYVYNGRYYEMVTTKTFLQELVKKTLKRIDVAKVYQKFSHSKIANECLNGMENCPEGMFVSDRNYIVFNNGVLNVEKGTIHDFDIKYRTDLVLDIDYDKNAFHRLWEEKIAEIIPNKEMREAFQMFCGTFLVNRNKLKVEYICYLVGPGSNGKSIVASAIASVFGEKFFGRFAPKKLLKSSDSMFNMASLDGKIANFTDDLDKEDLSGGDFKRFVSGEKLPARHPFGHHVFYVSAPLMLCCTNEMPATTDDSWGHHRRQLPIYSTTRVWGEDDKDPYLAEKLSTPEARTAIFNWIYEGYKKIIANGGNIVLGHEVIEAQLELRDDSNSARRWIRDMKLVKTFAVERRDPRCKYLSEWHKMYSDYCKSLGYPNPKNAKALSKLFTEKGFIKRDGQMGVKFCIGQLNVDTNDRGEYLAEGAIKNTSTEDDAFAEDLPF